MESVIFRFSNVAIRLFQFLNKIASFCKCMWKLLIKCPYAIVFQKFVSFIWREWNLWVALVFILCDLLFCNLELTFAFMNVNPNIIQFLSKVIVYLNKSIPFRMCLENLNYFVQTTMLRCNFMQKWKFTVVDVKKHPPKYK